ncbi:TRAP transporter small permease [Chloroflexota bacterium]
MSLRERLGKVGSRIASVTDFAGVSGSAVAGSCLCVMAVIMGYEVFMRYVLNKPTIWVWEVSHFLLAIVAAWGLAYGLKTGAHIRVEFLRERLTDRWRRRFDGVSLLLTVGVTFLMLWGIIPILIRSIERHQVSGTLLGIPVSWPQATVTVGLFLFAFEAVVLFWNHWRKDPSGSG